MSNLVLVFSGGCFSGKTTTINKFREFIGEDNSVVLGELIRKKDIKSIDDLRKNSENYLNLQKDIITEKIRQEISLSSFNNKIILIDRALSDSIFYLENYVYEDNLNSESIIKKQLLLDIFEKYAFNSFKNIYDIILEFKPLEKSCEDKIYRPENINHSKYFEYEAISKYNCKFKKSKFILKYDLNNGENIFKTFINKRHFYLPKRNQYNIYLELISKLFLFDNIYTNKNYSFQQKTFFLKPSSFMNCLLFSRNKELSDEIFQEIIYLKEFLKNKLVVHPIGFFKNKNDMFIVRSPLSKLKTGNNDLFPCCTFDKQSFYLKRFILDNFKYMPYITSLSKIVNENFYDSYNKCFNILMFEIKLLNPRKIYVVDNNIFKYLSERLNNELVKKLVKIHIV